MPGQVSEEAERSVAQESGEPEPRRWSAGKGLVFGQLALVILVALTGVALVLGFANKDRCTGPHFDQWGRSEPDYTQRARNEVCYSDIQYLWIGRDIDRHVFPYIHGSINAKGDLAGGTVEYPVLTGVLIWLGALFAHTDAGFLLGSAILMAPFGLLTAWLLGKLARWRALLWAIGPPLVLYAFHNWDLPVVLCAVAAVYVMHRGWGKVGANRPLMERATLASVLLGLGFTFKLYPAIFVLPLMLYVLTGGRAGTELPPGKRYDVKGMFRIAGVALGTAVLVNLPFALAGFEGWKASFTFQGLRQADITTNSFWFWGFRPDSDPKNAEFQDMVSLWSPITVLASFALALYLGWRRYKRDGTYPWIAVSAAMLCGFLLFHKVHSPQYTLWLVPMLVLLRVHIGWSIAYYIADIAMGIGIFRWYHAIDVGKATTIYDGFTAQAVMIGVWGRAALLVGLFFAFLNAKSTLDDPVPDTFLPGAPKPATLS
ncbi:putative membrane protein [Kibdelosporangium banguiense]|uniref:Membrane protein n=1 Tax=Kibdelosporangium banguiense TaxID=1365924 RepID=A0ABS4TD53_9PSEU|nr:glycosyltransferase 87 family protein [Kibdelosporangium banguiense]MBP2321894.1 putative membrane protein [Kibdelosporangium banguiense]